MGQVRSTATDVGGKGTEGLGPRLVCHFRVPLRQWPVDGVRESASLNCSDAHDWDSVGIGCRNNVAGTWEFSPLKQTASRVQQVGDALDIVRARPIGQEVDEGIGVADSRETLVPDTPLSNEPFKGRRHGHGHCRRTGDPLTDFLP